jgi:hypothetical protein
MFACVVGQQNIKETFGLGLEEELGGNFISKSSA